MKRMLVGVWMAPYLVVLGTAACGGDDDEGGAAGTSGTAGAGATGGSGGTTATGGTSGTGGGAGQAGSGGSGGTGGQSGTSGAAGASGGGSGGGSGGAAIIESDGVMVEIPAGAGVDASTLSITKVSSGLPALPGLWAADGDAFTFEPHGTTFDEPVTITLPYDGTSENAVVLELTDAADTLWAPKDITDLQVDTSEHTLSFKTSTFCTVAKLAGYHWRKLDRTHLIFPDGGLSPDASWTIEELVNPPSIAGNPSTAAFAFEPFGTTLGPADSPYRAWGAAMIFLPITGAASPDTVFMMPQEGGSWTTFAELASDATYVVFPVDSLGIYMAGVSAGAAP